MPLYLVQTLPQVSSQIERTFLPHVVEAPASNLQTRHLELVRNLVDRSSETGKPLPSLQVFLADFEAWLKTLAENNPLPKSIEEISAWTEHNNDLSKEATSDKKFAENNKNKLSGANLSGANLAGANLFRTNLANINLANANLFKAILSETNLTGANLTGANLEGADLRAANLKGAQLGFNQIRSLEKFKIFNHEFSKIENNIELGMYLASILPSTIGSKIQLVFPRESMPRHAHIYTAEWLEGGEKLKISYDDNELPHDVKAHMKGGFTLNVKTGKAEILNYSAIDKLGKNVATLENKQRPNFLSESLSELIQIIRGTVSPGQGSSIALYDPSGKRLSITYPAHIPSTAPDEKVREWADLQGIVLVD